MKVVNGEGPAPMLVLAAVLGLPDDSYTHALMRGGIEHKGWGQDRHMVADLIDAVNQNTRATGNWGKRPPKIPSYPRPKQPPKSKLVAGQRGRKKQKVSVAMLYGRMKSM